MDQHAKTRSELELRLATLAARVEKIEAHLRDPGSRDSQELVTERENDEVLEHLDKAELSEIEQIRTALSRMDDGSYGLCADCGATIREARLQALPYTALCIGCAE